MVAGINPKVRCVVSFLKKMFAPKDPVTTLKTLYERQDWAGLLAAAKRLDRDGLQPDTLQEIDAMLVTAGDRLALLNLEEGEWALRSGEPLRARDHFQLACDHARSPELQERAAQALAAPAPKAAPAADDLAAGAACSSCGPTGSPLQEEAPTSAEGLDEDGRLELLLATLPAEVADRYRQAGPGFRKAWLAVQDGDDEGAAGLLDQVAEAERDVLFFTERGMLSARQGEVGAARDDLRRALAADPRFFPAFEALVGIEAPAVQRDLLKQALAEERFTGFCWARLAELHAADQEWEPALAAGLAALDAGQQEPGILVLCARLLEREGRPEQAEELLCRLPAGGCGGGVHPLLAEFWLRQDKQLDRALESFKGALRQERDNPRWLLRIAQVYLAKGWRKDAAAQLERVIGRADLPKELQSEVEATAQQLGRA